MDDFERRVLRQRRVVLAEHVSVDDDLLGALRSNNLLSVDMMVIILNEKTNDHRMHKLVDFLLGCNRSTTFNDFCSVLQSHGDAAWLGKELQTEVRADRGNLVLDDDVVKESSMLIHRKFGSSKRFSETDKKEMTELIAIKIQVAKEEWKAELNAVHDKLQERKDALAERDQQVRKLRQTLLDFVKKHDKQLISTSHGMKSTSDTLRDSVPDDDLMGLFAENQNFVLERTHLALTERELLQEERAKIEKFLGTSLDTGEGLDGVIKDKMTKALREVEKLKTELAAREQKIEHLRARMSKMEDEIEDHQNTREELTNQQRAVVGDDVAGAEREIESRSGSASSDPCSLISSNGKPSKPKAKKKSTSEKPATRRKSSNAR